MKLRELDAFAAQSRRRQSKDPLERFDTPAWVTRALLAHLPALHGMRVIEPCAGAGAMSRVLEADGSCRVQSFDVAPRAEGIHAVDTLASGFWLPGGRLTEPLIGYAVVTNPPFSGAALLLRFAMRARVGLIALLVRLTWLEAVNDRADLPDPDTLLILPRPTFIESLEARAIREAAGKPWNGDNCTVTWAIWGDIERQIIRVTRREKTQLEGVQVAERYQDLFAV